MRGRRERPSWSGTSFPELGYVSLDFPAIAAQAEQNPDGFFKEHGLPLIIDEVQYAPSLFRYLKAMIDADRKPGRLLITGSQIFPLMGGISDTGLAAFLMGFERMICLI